MRNRHKYLKFKYCEHEKDPIMCFIENVVVISIDSQVAASIERVCFTRPHLFCFFLQGICSVSELSFPAVSNKTQHTMNEFII